jgi:UDP-N-acetylmuramyl pentapeptide phosphotransferase/UDP-N-acetylglucosamine-1-phosphate transferase
MATLYVFIIGFLTGWLCTLISIQLAWRYRVHDHPGARSSHIVPTPRLGGIGIFTPIYIFCILIMVTDLFPMEKPAILLMESILLGGVVCFFFGLQDDLQGMNAILKLVLQGVGAAVPVVLGMRIHSLVHFAGIVPSHILGSVLAFGWILLVINAYNFMDGMDGKAGSFAMVVSLFLVIIMKGQSGDPVTILLLLLAGASAGFLIYNLTPSVTFMGDCGSQFVGFILAVITLHLHTEDPVRFPFGTFVILLLPFLYDVLYTIGRRVLRGENILKAHRSHLYQRLLIAGYSHPMVLRLTFMTYLLCGLCALGFSRTRLTGERIGYGMVALLMMLVYSIFVRLVEKRKV